MSRLLILVTSFFTEHNLQVVGPIEPEGFTALDFESLCAYELQRRVTPVITALNETYPAIEELDR